MDSGGFPNVSGTEEGCDRMKIIILGGFLGSGKTTVLMQLVPCLAKQADDYSYPVVVLENEISTTDVDSKMLRNQGMEVRTLAAGCICCTSTASLMESVSQIREKYGPAYLVIEATGMAYPDSISRILREAGEENIQIVALADSKRWDKVLYAMPKFVESQLSQADIVFQNKTDLVTSEKQESVRLSIQQITPNAKIYPVCACKGIPEEFFAALLT